MSGPPEANQGRAALVAIGTELVADGRPDTNGVTVARHLAAAGYETAWRLAVPDDIGLIARALQDAAARFPLVVATGGLGPTVDDVTREAVALAFNLPLAQDDAVLGAIQERFRRYGRPVPEASLRQALVPRGAEVLPNDAGTAPGLLVRLPAGAELALLPGVPHEMERILLTQLLPRLRGRAGLAGAVLRARGMKVSGLSEVEVQQTVQDLLPPQGAPGPALTLLASPGEVALIVRGRDAGEVDQVWTEARRRLGDRVFTEDLDAGLETAAGRALLSLGLTLATAESCTGGLLGALVTRAPGSSAWYRQGWVTYANEAKTAMLGVAPDLLAARGAVSAEVADAMASGALARSGAGIAAAITGIAGPDGGTPDKPVGLVFISIATRDGARATRHLFPGDRETIRLFAARTALNRIRLEARGARGGA